VADDAGPLLARAGLISNEQLLKARQAQATHGGTLGEHLVLGGAISDEDLTSFYRTRLMVPRVDPKQMANIPPRVIARIPRDMAAEFRTIPVAVDREQNVILAMSDPSMTHAVDEIGFFTGAYVVRAVASQVEIAEALDRYYGIRTPLLALRVAVARELEVNALDAPSERRRVLPPVASGSRTPDRPVRISEIVPALREAKEAEAKAQTTGRTSKPRTPAVAGPDATTLVPGEQSAPMPSAPHERRTQRAERVIDPEDDTRPIARVVDLEPPPRVSMEQPVFAAGEIPVQERSPHESEKLAAVIIEEPPAAAEEATPILLTRKRPSEQIELPPDDDDEPEQEDVVVLSKKKTSRRRAAGSTRLGMGEFGADASKLPNLRRPPAGSDPASLAGPDPAAGEPEEVSAETLAASQAQTQQMNAISEEPAPTKEQLREAKTKRMPQVSVELPEEEREEPVAPPPAEPVPTPAASPVPVVVDESENTGKFERQVAPDDLDDGWGAPGSTIPPQYLGAYDDEPSSPLGIPLPDVTEAPTGPTEREVYEASTRRLATTMQSLATVTTRDEVIDELVAFMSTACRRAAFFAVKKGELRGWAAAGEGIATNNIDRAALELDKPSTFQDIVATRLPFHGPVHDGYSRDFLFAAVGAAPIDMTALPITLRDKVIGILYGDDRHQAIYDEHLTSLARAASDALERIVITRKTLS